MHNVSDRSRKTVIAAALLAALSITTIATAQSKTTTTNSQTSQTQNVNVVNTPAVTIKEPTKTPVHFNSVLNMFVGDIDNFSGTYDVPSGTRLVIETTSVSCVEQKSIPTAVVVRATTNSNNTIFSTDLAYIAPTPLPWIGGEAASTGTQTLHSLVDGPVSVIFYGSRPDDTAGGTCSVILDGYLTPIP